jgi:hypothetical protein
MSDRLSFFGTIFLEEICRRLVQLIENSSAGWNAGQSVTGSDHTCECGRTRQAQQPGKEQSPIHENLPMCDVVEAT